MHHSRWDASKNEDERGEQLAVKIYATDYPIPNENEATLLPTNGRSSSPDISLASNDIALLSDWSVSTSLANGHFLITINSDLSMIYGPRRTYISFKKADWARYAESCDYYLAEAGETRTVEQAEKTFRKAVNKASGLFFLAGRTQHFQSTLPASAKLFADEQDRKRGLNLANKTLNDLNKQIQKLVVEDKRTKWQSAVDKCDHRTGISHLWHLCQGPTLQKTTQFAQQGRPVRRQDLPRPQDDCNKFACQFTPPPIRLTGDKSKRQFKRQLHQLPLTGTPSITPAKTKEAIRLAKSSKAIGPTGCAPSTSSSSLMVPSTFSLTSSICQLDRYLTYCTKR